MKESTERKVEGQEIYRGKLLTLHRDIVEMPTGTRAVREVVHHPGAVAVVPFLNEDTLVLVRQFRYAVGEELVEIPAGTLKQGESPEECVQRELREEIGYEAKTIAKITSLFPAPGYTDEVIHLFIARDLFPSQTEGEEDEVVEPVFLTMGEAIEWLQTGRIKDGKTIAGLLLALDFIKKEKGG
ncbi:MAG: NUDIX hydrolase [Armatimonadetes bacterium]|nr:NUDIX hydrolase [Armatimonadota bacterium]MDW8122501.1 NUDIX hydrolase [Armatimonadota bacterium]